MAEVPDDVHKWVLRTFKSDEVEEALSLLASAVTHRGEPAENRLLRCAAVASRGDLRKLKRQVQQLKIDYRDVIVAGEYDSQKGKLVQVRNLEDPLSDP